ncbi:hypothetical protein MRB53_017044 [Persea americana]|uniref:Uncharacterized protein n=1 Tax=Persea americana TaxID=3435 RepID=A0ACC2M403_PERAE|nr:hypothetical protein MRB53_017044 [Persea americana]
MTMNGNNDNPFNSETRNNSHSLSFIEDLSHSLQDLHFGDLGLVENNQTGDERSCSLNGVSSTGFLGNHSSRNGIECTWSQAADVGGIPQREGWVVQDRDIERVYSAVQGLMNVNGDMGSLYSSNLIGLSAGHGVGPATGDIFSQLEPMGPQERGIWMTGSVGNPGVGSDTGRFPHWQDTCWRINNGSIGRDEAGTGISRNCLRQYSWGLYDGYNGSNSMRVMHSPDHLTGGLSFHGSQHTRTPFAEECSDCGNNGPYFMGTVEPLPEVVLQNFYRLQMEDLSLLEELSGGDIQVMAMDPMGCNYLLRILAQRKPFTINKILNGILEVVFEVMNDQIGNLLFKRLLKCCNGNQIERIIARVTEGKHLLIDVANTKSGTHSIQKLVKFSKKFDPMIGRLTLALIPRLHALMTNPYGCHVVICLSQIQGCHYPLLYEAIVEHCLKLATEERGCVTLNKCINNSKSPFREKLLTLISNNSVFLSQDPYGNFVVQHVLELEVPDITRNVCHKLKGNYARLSMQKAGSHVVEKCLLSSERDCIIRELVNSDKLDQLARDQYGNYVIQRAIKSSKGSLRSMLVKELMNHARSLRCHPYGRNVINFLSSSWISSSEGIKAPIKSFVDDG